MKKLRYFLIGLLLVAGIAKATVESVTYISDLNASYPASGDARSEGDDHIRNIKTAIRATFPNVSGAVTPTHTELNYVDGVTSAIQTQLNAKAAPADIGLHFISGGTVTATATLDITAGIDSTYEEYELHILNAVPANGAGAIGWLRTTADGSTWDATAGNYDWSMVANGTNTTGGSNATKIVISETTNSTTANGGLSVVIRITDPSDTTYNKRISCVGSGITGVGVGNLSSFTVAGARVSTAAIVGIRFLFSTGNIASLKYKLYGVRKS